MVDGKGLFSLEKMSLPRIGAQALRLFVREHVGTPEGGTGFRTGMLNGRVQAGLIGKPGEWDAESGSGGSIPLNLTVCAVSGDAEAAKRTTLDHPEGNSPSISKQFSQSSLSDHPDYTNVVPLS